MATPRHPLAGEPVGEPCPGQRALTVAALSPLPSFLYLSPTWWCRKLSGARYSIRNVLLPTDCLIAEARSFWGIWREGGRKILSIRGGDDLDFELEESELVEDSGGWSV